ncbi:PHP domain-containing protein [Ancylothrix sp. C2]|uniref:PHP domain-containing protein n=1 Tax=Ancylothrix sp. D3o TaxID=2953691 RepID=UPI0021BAD782|nr:PHP domain-containing protein [Ancylothrix sp. D3o]MCT7949721.1 PHP domain-containing protein [Ancylothrix sp. D3o]
MAVNLALARFSVKPPAQDMPALKQVFQSIGAASCPHQYNFHLHTIYSDGQLTPEELIEQAIEFGLQGLAITDHHSIGGYEVAQSWLSDRQESSSDVSLPHLWTGVEINADLLGCEVHILGYAFNPESSSMKPYLQGKATNGKDYLAGSVIEAIHWAGGLAVLAHPQRYRLPVENLIPAARQLGIDGVEAFYAYNNPSPWRPSERQTDLVCKLGAEYGLLNTCGTDTHGKSILQRL